MYVGVPGTHPCPPPPPHPPITGPKRPRGLLVSGTELSAPHTGIKMLQRRRCWSCQGWVVAYTDGSSKHVCGWMQAGYGVFYEESSSQNF